LSSAPVSPADLGKRILGAAVSTDGSFDLAEPTDVGLEFVMVDDGLDDIRWNGVSL
jgi:hypothetical protein